MFVIQIIFILVLGLALGSFLNVCIYRIPRDESIAWPPSKCPHCQTHIKYYDNIPLISYILLGGRCRNCKEKISIIYPVVEFFTAMLIMLLFLKFGLTFNFVIGLFLILSLVIVFFIDLEHKIIPVNFYIFLVPFILRFTEAMFLTKTGIFFFIIEYLGGGLFGFILLGLIKIISKPIFKRDALGMGDVYLFLYLGLFLGWKSIIYILFLSSIIGAIFSLIYVIIKRTKESEVPFGPFISIAAALYLFFSEMILEKFNFYLMFEDLIFILRHS